MNKTHFTLLKSCYLVQQRGIYCYFDTTLFQLTHSLPSICLCVYTYFPPFSLSVAKSNLLEKATIPPRYYNLDIDHNRIHFRVRNEFKLSLIPNHCPKSYIKGILPMFSGLQECVQPLHSLVSVFLSGVVLTVVSGRVQMWVKESAVFFWNKKDRDY